MSPSMVGWCYDFNAVREHAKREADSQYPFQVQDGTRWNAMFHMLLSAYSFAFYGHDMAETLMMLHEWARPNPNPKLNQMDRANNHYGFWIAQHVKGLGLTIASIKSMVVAFIERGGACLVNAEGETYHEFDPSYVGGDMALIRRRCGL
jgi:hypothetical protein